MIKNQIKRIVIALVGITVMCGSSAFAAKSNSSDVLVVPSRFTIVQLAFDIVTLRDVSLIAYESSDKDAEPVLFFWNKTTSAWESLTIDEYSVGSFTTATPSEMILIGSDKDLPASLISGASQAPIVTRIKSLNVAPVINELNKSMNFSPEEWKILAERHGLKIKDRNEELRRWGRYGPPGQKNKENKEPEVITPVAPPPCENGVNGIKDFEDDMSLNDADKDANHKIESEDVPLAKFKAPVISADTVVDKTESDTKEHVISKVDKDAVEDRVISPEDK